MIVRREAVVAWAQARVADFAPLAEEAPAGARLGAAAAVLACLLLLPWATKQFAARYQRPAFGCLLAYQFCEAALFAVAIPDTLPLAAEYGISAGDSAWLVSAQKAGTAVTTLLLYLCYGSGGGMLKSAKPLLLGSAVLALLGSALYAVELGYTGLLFAAGLRGFAGGVTGYGLYSMVAALLPEPEMPQAFALLMVVMLVGLGAGPCLSVAAHASLDPELGSRGAMCAMLCVLSLAMAFAATLMPGNLYADPTSEPSGEAAQKPVVVACCVVSTCRSAVVAALEAATIMILQSEPLLWDQQAASLFVAATFFFAVPFLWLLPTSEGADVIGSTRKLLGIAAAGALLLFHNGEHSEWSLFVSDVLLFPALCLANGVANGVQLQHCGGAWTVDRVLLANNLLVEGGGRLFGPPCARHLAASGGRVTYAVFQLGAVAVLSLAFELVIWPLRKADTEHKA